MAIFNYSVTKTPLRVLIICQSDQRVPSLVVQILIKT